MLSDEKSEVIRSLRVLNTEIPPGDIPAYGVPFPATFVTDENGSVVGRFIHRSYKIRSSPEHLLDSIRGEISIDDSAPRAEVETEALRIQAYFHGGRGTLRQGIERQVVVRFEPQDNVELILGADLESQDATSVEVTGPPGLVMGDPILPKTPSPNALDDVTAFQGAVDLAIPVYAQAELISECRPIENDTITIQVAVRAVVRNGNSSFPTKTETLELTVFLEPVDMPKLRFHGDTGQRRSDMDSEPHFRRLVRRHFRRHPIGAIRSLINTRRAQRRASRRAKQEA